MSEEKTWRSRMAKASFRGFEFLTDAHDAKGGRRLVIHEFPGAEEPVVEDLGGKAWDWKLNAYFIGKDYDLERNGFLEKLAEPGADWLTHPWLGYLWVRAHSWSIHESNDKGGFCTLSIEFVPGGEQPFTSQVDKVDVAIDRTRKVADAVVDDFALEPMSADGWTSFLASVHGQLEGLRQVISLATLPLTWANQVIGIIQGIKGDLAALMALPGAYGAALKSLANALGFGDRGADLEDSARPRVVARVASMSARQPATVPASAVVASPALRINLARESELRGRLLVVAAAQVALADYRSADDRDAALKSVVAALDALLPTMSDKVFQAAVSARTALIEALMAQDLRPLTARDVVAPLPATVLAHRMEVDEDVFIARNGVRHPLFVRGRVYG